MAKIDRFDAHRTPRHLWIVGGIALLWNAMGAMDYVMTQTRNEAYMSGFTAEQLAFFYGLPVWTVAAWAVGVWGSVLGSVLLLLRRRLAVWLFAASLIGILVTAFQNYFLADGMAVMGGAVALAFSAAIIVVALGLLIYSVAMSRRGTLV